MPQIHSSKLKASLFLSLLALCAIGAGLFYSNSSFADIVKSITNTQQSKMLDVQEIKTDSGITIWVVRDETLPITSLSFAFEGAGSINDPDDKQGLAQLLSNTLDEGAGKYTSTEFQKLLTDNSISLSFSQSRDHFSGHVKTLTRHNDLAFELLRLALTEPRFDEEAVDRMRDANLSRIRSALANPNWIAARITNDTVYHDHPYARNSGGTLSSLPNITPDDLRGFVKAHLGKDRLKIGIVSNLSAKEIAPLIAKTFGGLPDTSEAKKATDTKLTDGKEIALYAKEIPQTIIRMVWDGIPQDDPDYYAAKIMNYIYGGSGFGSRLMHEIREKRGLTYGVYSGLSHMEHANIMMIQTSTRNETASELLNLIEQERQKIISESIADEELTAAKDYLTGSLPLSLTSTDNISSLLLGLQLDNLPIDYLDKRNDYLNAVTADDVQRTAKRLLAPDNYKVILVGQPENLTPTITIEDLPNVN